MQQEQNHIALPRLIGTFHRQEWGGRKNDTAIPMGEVEFDATDWILDMPYEDLMAVEDDEQSSDAIGLAHVQWDGPHRVEIVDAICDFFGVNEISMITNAMQLEKRIQYPRASKPVTADPGRSFIEQVAGLSKWDTDDDEGNRVSECEAPSEGWLDSHVCLMDLIDQARTICRNSATGEGASNLPTLSQQARSTIIGALRLLQRECGLEEGDPIHDLITDEGRHQPMTLAEIDALCEAINS